MKTFFIDNFREVISSSSTFTKNLSKTYLSEMKTEFAHVAVPNLLRYIFWSVKDFEDQTKLINP